MQAYLEELARVRHFDRWRGNAPNFLIGSWTLLEPETDEIDGDPGRHCMKGFVIEDGTIRRFGETAGTVSARFRIRNGSIHVRMDGSETMHIDVPAYSRDRHEIEVLMPGHNRPLYGFRCH